MAEANETSDTPTWIGSSRSVQTFHNRLRSPWSMRHAPSSTLHAPRSMLQWWYRQYDGVRTLASGASCAEPWLLFGGGFGWKRRRMHFD